MNTSGYILRITTFGESHGKAIGVVIDGLPSGIEIDMDFLQKEMKRRRPGQSKITTQRKEKDEVSILSGVFEGKTTGTPLAMLVENEDQKSQDYTHIKDTFRPSHADYTYQEKYKIRDYRGGGRSSARETAMRVAAGAIAKMFLYRLGISIQAYTSQIGKIKLVTPYTHLDFSKTENIVRCPDSHTANAMIQLIEEVKTNGDTVGGVVSCVLQGVPVGIGEPIFAKLHAELGKAMLSINAAKGFEYGSGFDGVEMYGSEHNDEFFVDEHNQIRTRTNHSGGIQGGISNGEDIYFRVAFKPVATLLRPQKSVTIQKESINIEGKGRHDPCVVPRAIPIVEAMAALVLMDLILLQKAKSSLAHQ